MADAPTKECPMCGGTMAIKTIETVVRVPGFSKSSKKTTNEWLCPDCDYFEDVDEEPPRATGE